MPWYKISVDHGGGHQSHSERFVWRDERASKAEREQMFEDFCEDRYMENAIGKVRAVAKLPEKVRREKIDDYRYEIDHAKRMLKILGA